MDVLAGELNGYATAKASVAKILGDAGLGKNPLRPFGATPTAALVDDLQVFLQTDGDITRKTTAGGPGDPFYGCRPRSAVLITDGFPNARSCWTPSAASRA